MDTVLSRLLDRSCSRRPICCELFVTCRPRRNRNQAVKRATSRAACVPCDPGLRKLILMDWKLCPFHLSCASFQTAWLILLARSFQRLPCNTWINVVCLFSSFFFFLFSLRVVMCWLWNNDSSGEGFFPRKRCYVFLIKIAFKDKNVIFSFYIYSNSFIRGEIFRDKKY